MLLITTEQIPGKEVEFLGIVEGSMVQSVHVGKDFLNGLKTLVGGELTSYTEMMEDSRRIATERMMEQAQKRGADAVLGVRYTTSSIMQGSSEVLAYGTAVRFVIYTKPQGQKEKGLAKAVFQEEILVFAFLLFFLEIAKAVFRRKQPQQK